MPNDFHRLWQKRCDKETYEHGRKVLQRHFNGDAKLVGNMADARDTAAELMQGYYRCKSTPSLAGSETMINSHIVLPRRSSKIRSQASSLVGELPEDTRDGFRSSQALSSASHRSNMQGSSFPKSNGGRSNRARSNAERFQSNAAKSIAKSHSSSAVQRPASQAKQESLTRQSDVSSIVQAEILKYIDPLTQKLFEERQKWKETERQLEENLKHVLV